MTTANVVGVTVKKIAPQKW